MDLTTLIVIAAILGILAVVLHKLTTMKCPHCGSAMTLLTENVGRTKKYECNKCRKRVDTGVPTGRGKT